MEERIEQPPVDPAEGESSDKSPNRIASSSQRPALLSPLSPKEKLHNWLDLLFLQLLIGKLRNNQERRAILAFAAATAFLLFSFWNSLEPKKLHKDLKNAKVQEWFTSGRISQGTGVTPSRSIVTVYVQIDDRGKPLVPAGTPESIANNLRAMQFDPPKRNGATISVKVPLTIDYDNSK